MPAVELLLAVSSCADGLPVARVVWNVCADKNVWKCADSNLTDSALGLDWASEESFILAMQKQMWETPP